MGDSATRYITNVTKMTSCIGNKIQQRFAKLRDGFDEGKSVLIHDVIGYRHHNWHPWQELKRLQFHKNVRKEFVFKPSWEPGIETGYRPPYKPWRYYLASLFQWHNESVNVWTHLIGTLVIAMYMVHFHHTMDYCNNPRAWPHLILGICGMICTSASCVAHLLHSKSAFAHYVTLSFDYAGAGIYAFAVSAAIFYYSSDDRIVGVYLIGHNFLTIMATLSAIMCFCCCYGKVKYSLHHHLKRKLWFVLPTALPYTITLFVAFPRYVSDYLLHPNPEPAMTQSWRAHLCHMTAFFSATFFFVSHVPEIFAHGEFDMIGQGHQLWHVLLVCTVVFQMHATQFDYNTRQRSPEITATLPRYEMCFYALAALIIANLIFIFYTSRIARKVVDEERQELESFYDDQPVSGPMGNEAKQGEDRDADLGENVKVLRSRTVIMGKSK